MQIVIDIPESYYNLTNIQNGSIACSQILKAVKNGIPYEERPQGEWVRLDLAKMVIARFEGYLDDDMIYRIQIALEAISRGGKNDNSSNYP